jgi:site-specific DNA recombinase
MSTQENTKVVEPVPAGLPSAADFDPAAAPDAVLVSRSLDEMFELSMRQRQPSLDREKKFREAIEATNPVGEQFKLSATTVRVGRIPVAIYARYSDDAQNPMSIEDQIAHCLRYCEVVGYEAVIICSDAAMTGQSLVGREGWAKAMRAVRDGLVAIIVAESLDRVARDSIDLLVTMEELRQTGAAVDTPSTGRASELHGLLHAIYNTLFRAGLVQKVLRGMRGAVGRGRHPGGTNFGLKKVRAAKEEDDDYFPDEDQAKIYFRVMWEIGVLKKSYGEIARDLNSEGIKAPRGGLWTSLNFIHANGLGGLAINTRCIGILQWNKASYPLDRKTNKHKVKKNPREEWVIGFNANNAFIPLWLWEKVQAEVAIRTLGPSGERGATPRRLLTKRLKCSICSAGMNIYAADKTGRPRVGCSTYRMRGDCSNKRTYYLDTIEKMAARALKEFLDAPDRLEQHFEAAVRAIEVFRDQLQREMEAQIKEREQLRPLTVALVHKMAAAGVNADDLKKIVENDLNPIYQRQADIGKRIREIESLLSSDRLQPQKVHKASDAFADLEKLLEATGGKDLPRELIDAAQAIIGKVELAPDPDSHHFELMIEGRFDALVGDDLIGPLAVISSADYKFDRMGASPQLDKLILGKPFSLVVTSRTMPDPLIRQEVRELRLVNQGNHSHRDRCRKLDEHVVSRAVKEVVAPSRKVNTPAPGRSRAAKPNPIPKAPSAQPAPEPAQPLLKRFLGFVRRRIAKSTLTREEPAELER